ncbi:MAG: SpoIIE family protein phosphatase, partial [Candidatus Riflebacteria bacterium]|nr:SpoIIE family protein phosphatase [Candidatus Riflebacteria bacterium]
LDRALATMKTRILAGAIIALILLASITLWITRHLISPLERLGDGIQALAARNFEARIPVPPGKDEISQLFLAFNDMMAESYDMQIAHNVQEGLVPSEFPAIEGYSMYGMLRAASDLGGDCLDCFKLPNGNLLFLVGDLTGHGVGSALMMAFARAVTFHWSQGDQLSPASLVDQIDSMLRENRTERMFMGIICGVLNLETHKIELVTKGHIYPLKFSANGNRQWVGQPAYPLGIARQQPASSITFDFGPGDKLLCMTDGFLEAYNRNMRTIGFDGIETWASEARADDARTWINSLEARFKIWCDNKQSDDVSIFALIRSAGGNTADER